MANKNRKPEVCKEVGMRLGGGINAPINILKRDRAGLARTDAQVDNCRYASTGNASSIKELRAYPAITGKPARWQDEVTSMGSSLP